MIFCWRHSFYCSKRKTKFHKVETGRQTLAESVGKHTPNSKLKPQGRDGDSTDGLISVRPPRNGPWIQLPTSGLQGAWIFSGTRVFEWGGLPTEGLMNQNDEDDRSFMPSWERKACMASGSSTCWRILLQLQRRLQETWVLHCPQRWRKWPRSLPIKGRRSHLHQVPY